MEDAPRAKTILVVDDERHIVRLTVEALQAAGYATAHAYDGVEAMEWLDNNPPPALILLDVMMPRKDGFDVINWVRERPCFAGTPAVLFLAKASFGSDYDTVQSLRAWVDSWLWKPFSAEDVVAIVQRRLAGVTGPLPWGYQPKPPPERRNL
jgi:two-component system alkaline phosphatase synthesis response regulator PhoP